MKILVVIANYGFKNIRYLEILINEYNSMPYDIDIVVLSNVPKELGPNIEVIVGLPSKNPWSLPFGHKQVFAKRVDDYDLFIYSEDDTLITEKNIRAFLETLEVLPKNKIAGFIRYEKDLNNRKIYTTIHGHYHWDTKSVESIGKYTFAFFTNEHSACYILSQEQLRQMITSGGFLTKPREGVYDMLCTASTDPYTQCGFRKVICISQIEDFSLHHLPNAYLGKMGLGETELAKQIEALQAIQKKERSSEKLLRSATNSPTRSWNKKYYNIVRHDVLGLIPESIKSLLSVGCDSGDTEAVLIKKGVRVVGIPLDSVIASTAKMKGVDTVDPDFEIARKALSGELFDCILFLDLIHLLPDPVDILRKYSEMLGTRGNIIISVPNFNHISLIKKKFSIGRVNAIGGLVKSSLDFPTQKKVKEWFCLSNLEIVSISMSMEKKHKRMNILTMGLFKEILASEIVFVGEQNK